MGTLTLDRKGNVTGHTIATTDDGATTVIVDFTFSGTYSVRPDGTGTLSITTVNQTDNEGGGAKVFLTGQALRR